MKQVLHGINTILSPPYCIDCQCLLTDYSVLCINCIHTLPKPAPHPIRITDAKSSTVYAYTLYQHPLEQLVRAKFTGNHTGTTQLAYLLAQYVKSLPLDVDYIAPIPLHWYRRFWRGFNQADVLAHAVATVLRKPVVHALKRVKNTAFQSTLVVAERKKNLHAAFICTVSVKNKRILLIDDLYTTGATATAAARELYAQGAASVELLVACKVIT